MQKFIQAIYSTEFTVPVVYSAEYEYSTFIFYVVKYNYINYVSQFTVETYYFADGRCLFKQPQSVIYHWNQYDEEISKKCTPSVC